jgi:hypothetical protein
VEHSDHILFHTDSTVFSPALEEAIPGERRWGWSL